MKITKDGFVWCTMPKEMAQKIYDSKPLAADLCMFCLYPDDSEAEIQSLEDLKRAIDSTDCEIGNEVGQITQEHLDYITLNS